MKKLLIILLALLMVFAFAACGQEAPPADPPADTPADTPADAPEEGDEYASTPEYTFKLGYAIARDGSPHTVYAETFAEYVYEYSKGRIQIDLYPAGQLGNERELFEGVTMGTVDFYYGGTAVLSYWTDDFYEFNVPYLFRSWQESCAVYDSDYMDDKTANLESLGAIVFGYSENGFNDLISNAEIYSPEDLNGLTIRHAEDPVLSAMYVALGVNPVTVGFSEAFTLLQNGSVDALTMPDAVHYANQLYTIGTYLVQCQMYATNCILCGSQTALSVLSDEDMALLKEAAHDSILAARPEAEALSDASVEKMISEGAIDCELNMDEWYAAAEEKCWPNIVETGYVSMDTINAVREIADSAK